MAPTGYPYFLCIPNYKNIITFIKEHIRGFLEREDIWKRRFSNDVLPLIDQGIKYVYSDNEGIPCLGCYEKGYGEHKIYSNENNESIIIIVNHIPNTLINFKDYLIIAADDTVVLQKNNYIDFHNWYTHWHGPYMICLNELKSKTYKIQCCSDIYPCGGKSYYDGWLCDNHTNIDLFHYMRWVDPTTGILTIDEYGEFRVTIGTLDPLMSALINDDECLLISKRESMNKFEIALKSSQLKIVFNPVACLVITIPLSSSVDIDSMWPHIIHYETFRNHDKCMFQIRNTIPRTDYIFDLNEGYISVKYGNAVNMSVTVFDRRDKLLLNGYYTGVTTDAFNPIDNFESIWYKNYDLFDETGLAYQEYIANYIHLY